MQLDELAGKRLSAVRYYSLPDLADERYMRYSVCDDVSMAIELVVDPEERYTLSWVLEGGDAWVAVTAGPVGERYASGHDLVPVEPAWSPWPLGHHIAAVREALGAKPAEEGLTRVGIRFVFDSGDQVTVALGEVDDQDALGYSADNLVVLFDPTVAERHLAVLAD